MPRKKDTFRRKIAFLDYARNGQNLSKAAETADAPLASVRRWRDEEQWDTKLKDADEIVRKELTVLSELRINIHTESAFLDVLRKLVIHYVSEGFIRPSTWSDVLATLKYVDEKKKALRLPADPLPPLLPGKVEEGKPIAEGQIFDAEILESAIGPGSKSGSN